MAENGKTFITQQYDSVFGKNKAYSLGISNGKVRFSITTGVTNNGKQNWDFRNATGINMDFEDLNKFLSMCKTLAHIFVACRRDSSIKLTNPLYNTTCLRMPLVAKSNGSVFGELTVALVPDPDFQNELTFGVKYVYVSKDGVETKDYFIFRRSAGAESEIQFKDGSGMDIHVSHNEHLQFANFIRMLESILTQSRVTFGLQKAIKFDSNKDRKSGGSGSYGGYSNSSGGESSGGSSSGGDDNMDDIPF